MQSSDCMAIAQVLLIHWLYTITGVDWTGLHYSTPSKIHIRTIPVLSGIFMQLH